MKTRFLLLTLGLTLFGCATTPDTQAQPNNAKSVERAEKSFQELDKEID